MPILTNADLAEIKKRVDKVVKGNLLVSLSALQANNKVLLVDVPSLLAEVERLNQIVLDREKAFEEALCAAETYDMFLQEIDTHLRATPEPIPHIYKTMRQYIDYREGDADA